MIINENKNYLLGDWGEAKKLPEEKDYSLNLTGTVHYLSPELEEAYINEQDIVYYNPFKADIYALGLIQ